MKNINKIVLSLFALLIFSPVFSQKKTVTLNLGNLGNALKAAPMETSQAAKTMPLILNLPMATADERAFRVVESPIMAPDFAAAYPSFRTYAIQAVDDPSVTGRISITPFGFNGVILTLEGMVVIRPLDLLNPIEHEVSLSNFSAEEFLCDVDETITSAKGSSGTEKMAFTNGSTKRTYSLAIVCTGEFHNANGGSIAAASAVVTSSVNGIQAIYERELAVNFQLLTPFIYTNPATDPFNAGLNRTLEAAQAVEANFPGGNYDVGHVFHDQDEPPAQLPGGGVAFLNAVCVNSPVGTGFLKGGGWSGSFDNVSAGWIKLATHEFGHMFGMPHTFNGTGGSCTSNIDDDNSYEIASGNSIMSYNGICGAGQNIPDGGTADHYFHYNSLDKAVAHMNAQSCHTGTATGNSPPTVNANACGGPYTIPKSTPFRLTGSGTDPDGDQIYYSWEQYDEDGAGMTPTQGFIGATAGASSIAPLFRSYPPVTTPTRLFPNMNLVAAGSYSSDFEPLPSVARTLNFRLTGRDWKMGGGGIHSSELAVTVSNNGPFSVTAPNGGETIAAGSNTTVTWNVNGTNAFCTNVNIRLSIDGGLTFPYLLLASTPNDGSQSVTLPTGVAGSTTARVMVECADNTCVVFFDISNNNFTVTSACSAAGSNICPTTAMKLPVGDPGLNLNLSRHFGTSVTQRTFSITNGSPTGPLANATVQGGNVCQTPWGNEKFDTFDFAVETSGSYTLNNTSGGQIIFSVFVAAGYNPAMPCSSTFLGSNATGAISWFSSATVTLNACTVYKVVVWTLGNANASPTLTISGTGTVYASGAGPGADYSYTYVAVNTANSQVAAVSANSNFTALGAGSYQIYGASYYSGAGPNPPTVNPNTWVGQTMSAILSGGACALFSTNFKSLTITPPGGTPNVAISGNPSMNEGNAGPTAFTFTVTRTGNNANQSTVNWTVTGSGANPANAADFTGGNFPSGTVTFPAGSSANQTITVNVNGDTDLEPDEGFTVTLSNPVNANITTATATGTILNDDMGTGCLANYCAAGQSTGTCGGGDEFISNVTFNTINNSSTCAQSLPSGYTNYTNLSTSVNIGTSYTLNVTNGGPFTGDQCKAWFDWNADGDFTDAGEEFTLTGSGTNNAQNWTVMVLVPNGAATGSTRMRVRITFNTGMAPCGTSQYGETEDYCLTISGGGTPSIAISGSPSLNEGNAGPTAFTFTVTRTGNIANQSSASWTVTGSGGNPANGADFTGGNFPSGTVTFPAGSNATQTITVNVNGDTDVEPDEGFTVTLSNPMNATITTGTANGNILNDDAAPVPSIAISGSPSLNEGNAGPTAFTFTVTRTGNIANQSSASWAVTGSGGNQANGADFTGGNFPSGTVTFPAGSNATQTITVNVNGDTDFEPNEGFTVTLSNPVNATITTATASGTILNDDAEPVPSIAISGSPSMNEGNAGPTAFTFTVTRTGNIANQSSASWAVTGSGGNPANGADFTGGNFPSGTVTFPAGSAANQTITVNVNGDTDIEPNEGFTVTLSNPVNATITTATANGTILNDDAAPGYCTAGATSTGFEKISNVQFNTINNPSNSTAGYEDFTAVSTTVAQGSTHTFTGTISNPYSTDEIIVWIDFNQDLDFDDPGEEVFNSPNGVGPHSGNINIPANAMTGATRMRVRLHDTAAGPNAMPCGDSDYGQVEDYTINISAAVPSIAISGSPSLNEGNAGPTAFTFTVTRTGNIANQSSTSWAVTGSGGNPANGADFTGGNFPSGTVTFPAGSNATQTITVNVNGDTDVEPNEGFTVTLSNPMNATITTATANGTIQNDDASPGYCAAGATSTGFEKISNVQFNTINNPSNSTAGYEDFTAVSTTVAQGSTHTFTGTISNPYTVDEIIVWIDFNQDLDFEDPGEEVFNSPNGVGPHSGPINIPANAMTGNTRMRVRLHDTSDGPNNTPCGNSTYGQVEDYTINITVGNNCPNTLAVPGTIANGTYQAAMTLTSNGTVPNGNSVTFKAGTSIELQPNFEVILGGVLTTLMEGCTPFAPPAPKGNGDQ